MLLCVNNCMKTGKPSSCRTKKLFIFDAFQKRRFSR